MPATLVRYKDYDGTAVEEEARTVLDRAANDPFSSLPPYPLLRSMLEPEARPDGISVTRLKSGCLRCTILQEFEPYVLDLSDSHRAWRGTVYHSLLEKYQLRGTIAETRFWADVPGMPGHQVHGKPDILWLLGASDEHGQEAAILDLKTTKNIPTWDKVWPDHNQQLQFYRWLVNHATRWDKDLGGIRPQDLHFTRLGIWYVDDSTYKCLEVRKSLEVATKPGAKYGTRKTKVPDVWTDEVVEAQVAARYAELQSAREAYMRDKSLPPYPPGFQKFKGFPHAYSPVADLCVQRWVEEELRGAKPKGLALKLSA